MSFATRITLIIMTKLGSRHIRALFIAVRHLIGMLFVLLRGVVSLHDGQCPDRGACNGPEPLGLGFCHQSSTFINAYCQAATSLVDRD